MNEKTFLASLKSGNHLAYQQLFDEHYALLVSYAQKLTNDLDQSREVVQVVFVRLYEKRKTLNIEKPKSYLLRAVHNECLQALKSQKRFIPSQENDRVIDLDYLEQAERESEIWQAINALPPKCHEIFVMNRFEGLKNQQIADQLGITKRTVETQISLALKQLREKLLNFLFSF